MHRINLLFTVLLVSILIACTKNQTVIPPIQTQQTVYDTLQGKWNLEYCVLPLGDTASQGTNGTFHFIDQENLEANLVLPGITIVAPADWPYVVISRVIRIEGLGFGGGLDFNIVHLEMNRMVLTHPNPFGDLNTLYFKRI